MGQAKQVVAYASVLLLAVAAGCSDQPVTPATPSVQPAAPSAAVGASTRIASATSANITGPCAVPAGGSGTWDANASGGTGTYTYEWRHRAATSTTWSVVIYSGSSYTRKVGPYANSFYLRVTVTSGGVSVSDDHYVEVGDTYSMCELLD